MSGEKNEQNKQKTQNSGFGFKLKINDSFQLMITELTLTFDQLRVLDSDPNSNAVMYPHRLY